MFRRLSIHLARLMLYSAFWAFAGGQSKPNLPSGLPAGTLASQPKGVPVKTSSLTTQSPVDGSAQNVVKITISSSRSSVSRDGSYGVFADIENVSSAPITLRSAEIVLVIQPEVSQPDGCVNWEYGIFPTQVKPNPDDPYKPDSKAETVILPNEHYSVFWDLTSGSPPHGTCSAAKRLGDYLGFVPGDYTFSVEGVAYSPSADSSNPPTRHTFTEVTTLKVGISQIATAIAALLGALLAYLVVALQPGQDFEKWTPDLTIGGRAMTLGVILRNVFSAGLLGAAVTIVASRLADTQFPVKVSVNDFWGALTIGFVAYFIGSKFIISLATRLSPSPPKPTVPPPSTSPAPPNPVPVTPSPTSSTIVAGALPPEPASASDA